jgi:hypothetical protein
MFEVRAIAKNSLQENQWHNVKLTDKTVTC